MEEIATRFITYEKNSIFIFLIMILTVSCSSNAETKLSNFPLEKGTTWVYSYESYGPSASDPTHIIKATYELTESVNDVETVSINRIVHMQREFKLLEADANWTDDITNQPKESWYIVSDQRVFQSYHPLDTANINFNELSLAYEFPLTLNATWCLAPMNSKEMAGCEYVGKREVTNQSSYETQAEKFDDCFDMIDYYNGGNIYQKFCNGVGIVSMKFDHAGTRFGFEQTLIRSSVGVP